MKLGTLVDRVVRRSHVAKLIPYLRQRTPRTYSIARSLFNRAVPLKSRYGLARHQVRALDAFVGAIDSTWLESVLEIGSDVRGLTVRELRYRGASRVVGINPVFSSRHPVYSGPESGFEMGCAVIPADARRLPFRNASLSAIFSVSVWEHLLDLECCLSEMYRVLRPGGWVYADFGPVWSCSIGHHVFAVVDGEEARHWKPETNPVPNYGHLLMDRDELEVALAPKVSRQLLAGILRWIYDSDDINRLFLEDYERIVRRSAFETVRFETDEEHVDRQTLALLRKRHGDRRFGSRNGQVLLRKPL